MEQSNLLMQYYQAILCLQDEKDIKNALPNTEYACFDYIMNGLLELIDEDIKKNQNLLNHEFDSAMREYIQDDINILLFKKQECEELIKEANQKKENETLSQTTPHRNIIFATSTSSKVYLKEDLKEIAEEYYQDIADCLDKIENEKKLNAIERQLGNHAKLAKIHELRPFKIRVCYKMLAPDLVYVMIAKYKKSDNDRIEREKIIERNKQTKDEFDDIIKAIKDPIKKQQLIEANELVKQDILEYINTYKRGETK